LVTAEPWRPGRKASDRSLAVARKDRSAPFPLELRSRLGERQRLQDRISGRCAGKSKVPPGDVFSVTPKAPFLCRPLRRLGRKVVAREGTGLGPFPYQHFLSPFNGYSRGAYSFHYIVDGICGRAAGKLLQLAGVSV